MSEDSDCNYKLIKKHFADMGIDFDDIANKQNTIPTISNICNALREKLNEKI